MKLHLRISGVAVNDYYPVLNILLIPPQGISITF